MHRALTEKLAIQFLTDTVQLNMISELANIHPVSLLTDHKCH